MAAGARFLGWLDPFSHFGRLCHALARPVYIMANNTAARLLESVGAYLLYPVELGKTNLAGLVFAAVFFLLLAAMAGARGRLFCNTLCPVGALLGLFAKISRYRIKIDRAVCSGCGLCERVCKAQCIDAEKGTVDFSRCVSCFNCLAACPQEGIRHARFPARKAPAPAAPAVPLRRAFMKSALTGAGGACGLGWRPLTKGRPPVKPAPVSPPGSGGHERLLNYCTACQLCVSACPARVLQPALLEYGAAGLLHPRLDFQSGYCDYNCNLCSAICPAGALRPLALEEKKRAQLGAAVFVRNNCIVYRNHAECGACAEHCPTKAVHLVPYHGVHIPEVRPHLCTGCGACEHVCPAEPFKAIYVRGLPLHARADRPESKPAEKTSAAEEFPF